MQKTLFPKQDLTGGHIWIFGIHIILWSCDLVQRLGSKVTDTIMSTLWAFSSHHHNPPIFSVTSFQRITQISIIWDGSEKRHMKRVEGGGNPKFSNPPDIGLHQPLPGENLGLVGS